MDMGSEAFVEPLGPGSHVTGQRALGPVASMSEPLHSQPQPLAVALCRKWQWLHGGGDCVRRLQGEA